MGKMKLRPIFLWLLVIGGLNWGLVSFMNFNLVEWLGAFAGAMSATFMMIVYGLVAISALATIAYEYKVIKE